jgi:hypothetical protein
LATIKELVRYWENDYDWREPESKLQPQLFAEEVRAAFRSLR